MKTVKFFLWLITLMLSQSIVSQEVITLPNSATDLNWPTEEREYMSHVWGNMVTTNVSKPEILVYKPENPNGVSVIICPGGGLYALSIDSEGRDVAQWLSKKGVTAFVLKYRLVPTGVDGTSDIMNEGDQVLIRAGNVLPLAVEDGLNAISHVRKNAATYHIDPNKIGLIGFSAGGAVTMGVSFAYTKATRPDFIGPVYAWMDVVPEHEVPADAPPMFVVCAADDPLNLAPASVKLYQDWTDAGKISELHMYTKGGHGFGMKQQNLPSDTWIERFNDWMIGQGLYSE